MSLIIMSIERHLAFFLGEKADPFTLDGSSTTRLFVLEAVEVRISSRLPASYRLG